MLTLNSSSIIIELIISIFLDENIKYSTIFNCWDPSENHNFAERLSENSIYSHIFSLNDEHNLENYIEKLNDMRNYSQIGIFLDYDCFNSEEIIYLSEDQNCFSKYYKWIIVEKGRTILKQLETTNLNLATEITFADLTDFQLIPLYDVYNNGYFKGGKLNITFDRSYTVEDGLTKSTIKRKTKYNNRCDLSDITVTYSTAVSNCEIPDYIVILIIILRTQTFHSKQ